MPIRMKHEIIIQRPVEEVFAFVADFSNNAIWQSGILETETLQGAPLQSGARFRCVNRFWGQRFETQWQLLAIEPNTRCHFEFASPVLQGATRFNFEAIPDGTRLIADGEADLGRSKLPALLVRPKIRQQMRHDLNQLKKYLESNGKR